jgi:ParB-like chromosome segregation protein Spo0J
MQEKPIISYLRFSSKNVGRLYPVLIDKQGNIIDGLHRLKADKNWPKIKLENVKTEEQRLITRLISNVCRRNVPAKEKTETLAKLGEIYQKEGVKPGKIAQKIAEKTGMTCRWVTKYLPDKFKDPLQSKRASSAERRSAENVPRVHALLKELLSPPQRKGALEIKKYANTHFVNVVVEKSFYEEFEKTSSELGVSTEISMLKALEEYHEKMKKALELKKPIEKAKSSLRNLQKD